MDWLRVMDLPENLIFSNLLVQGGGFRSRLEVSGKYRFYFILNQNPKDDDVILLATATTKITEHKSKWPAQVLVEITPCEYHPLKQNSLVNCEFIRAYSKGKLKKNITSSEFEILEPLPSEILKKILDALAECKNIAPIDKLLALGEEK